MREYNNISRIPDLSDRLISALSYITAGIVGFIWIIYIQIAKKQLGPFVKFHVFQSIFISVIYYLFNIILGILMTFVKLIPFIGELVINIVFYIFQLPVFFGFSIFQFAVILLLGYLVFNSLIGRYGYVPWVSDNIKKIM